MKNKILAMLLSFTLIFTTTGFSFADGDEATPAHEPEKKSEQVVEKKAEPAVEKVVVKEEASKVEATPEETKEDVAPAEATKPVANEIKQEKMNSPPEGQKPGGPGSEQEMGDKPVLTLHLNYMESADVWVNDMKQLHKKDFPYYVSDPPEVSGYVFKYWINTKNNKRVNNPLSVPNSPKSLHLKAVYEDKPVVKDVTVTFVGNHEKFVYDGESHRVMGYEFKSSDPEYTEEDFRYTPFADKVDRTDVGTTEVVPQDLENINPNYNVTFVIEQSLAVTITPAKLTVVVTGASDKVVFNNEEQFAGPWTWAEETGSVVNITPDPLIGPVFIPSAHGKDVGEYHSSLKTAKWTADLAKGLDPKNYEINFKFEEGTLVITPMVIEGVLTIHDKTKIYGEEDPEFTYTWDGEFKIPKPTLFRQEGENIGDYRIMAEINGVVYNAEPTVKPVKKIDAETKVSIADKIEVEKVQSNYDYRIKVIDGNLKITPREITIAAVHKFKMLKDVTDDEEFDATVTGVLPQDEEWFEEEVYWDVDCDYEEAVGDYPIIVEAEWDPDIYIIDDPIFPWPGEFEEWPQEMKKVEGVPMMAAKSVGLKKNSTIVAGNYTIKTVDNVFQIRDNVIPPVDPDNPVVDPTDNDSTVNKASGIVKTGDADACWALLNLLLMITSCLFTFLVVLSRVLKRDEEYVDESKSFFNNWFESILSGVVAVFTAIVFFITENMNTLMVWTDRWTVMMIVLFVLQLAVVAYVKFRDKIFEEDN